jgi:hypothetical protein
MYEKQIEELAYLDTTITELDYCIDRRQHSPVFQTNQETERKADYARPFLIKTTKPLCGRKH